MPPKRKLKRPPSECAIPPVMAPSVAGGFVFERVPHAADDIRRYVESQSHERVTHLEKVGTETLPARKLDAWDVRTDADRYWVITNPTNLYSQVHFPSLDYTLTFHIGLTTRIAAQRAGEPDEEQRDRLAPAWRRWTQAAEALDRADEAEQFQAIGMQCREALLAVARGIASSSMVPSGQQAPKAGDFIHWSELIADAIAPGPNARELRSYLKAVARSAWSLVNAVTHAQNAVRFDASMAVEATQSTFCAFGAALVRHERGAPDRCPGCSSYRVASVYMPEIAVGHPYRSVCESCGWTDKPRVVRRHGSSRVRRNMTPDQRVAKRRARPTRG